ncbi:alanine:cation symporter family protein [Salipaludibacillus agaradhaerens]|uniref:Alanine:cation symporter family protein n=1 Tax=Salipaludibacillus agaradhaerens TaxID=76935 RepID=A0A9Q4G074_SALAG|nr:alanine/glycine:cation symporter family protein [Salipaludibacillus agaradhaerens]UJW56593.1 alanine:cation symporter family protein [Bacillus sp. A116_S68]MCR6097787.1 alanine:cation symporter family protein [Salipaludibacillus agaradhaerens]MCR6105361.1 alanine:cation symporter family protein [Salipaludibacillus agaradhaerens]MCR6116584.1 alanine:cation symporter family protein [Salipaludibacillus agaradhaerens]MCR6117402.1 alanine:cation symporter family protein [Salipaludibacillus agara
MDQWFATDTWFGELISIGNNLLWTYILIGFLLLLGLYLTVKTNFVQFRMLPDMFKELIKGTDRTAFKERKGTSPFQAFAISTAARVGTGNLAGVALAISVGGPGAIFWMWVVALVGAATGFIESTLAQIYKVKDKDGFRGGPAYYMEKGLGSRGMGLVFAVLIVLCFGLIFNGVQTHTISDAFVGAYNIPAGLVGVVIAVMMAFIIFGGVRRIAVVAEVIVPVFALTYIVVALIIMMMNITEIPAVFALIFNNAFGIEEVVGGGLGAVIMNGVQRGLFSNEAGMGSAPNAAATVYVKHPVKQGLIQSLSVLIDTLIICSATAFIVLLTDVYTVGEMEGIQLTQQALAHHMGDWATIFVTVAIFFFAFSSLLGNYYYGEANIGFISEKPIYLTLFRLAFLAMVVIGATSDLDIIWEMADLFMGLMAVVNLIAVLLLGKIAISALKDFQQQRKAGIDPVFYRNSIKGLKNVESWGTKEEEK